MSSVVVDLNEVAGPVYSGRDRGEAVRQKFRLDEADAAGDTVRVVVPKTVFTVSSSFFLGMLGPSVRRCGSLDEFERKFKFDAPAFLLPILRGHAALALQTRQLLG